MADSSCSHPVLSDPTLGFALIDAPSNGSPIGKINQIIFRKSINHHQSPLRSPLRSSNPRLLMKVKAASQQLPFSQAAIAALYLAQGLGTMGSALGASMTHRSSKIGSFEY